MVIAMAPLKMEPVIQACQNLQEQNVKLQHPLAYIYSLNLLGTDSRHVVPLLSSQAAPGLQHAREGGWKERESGQMDLCLCVLCVCVFYVFVCFMCFCKYVPKHSPHLDLESRWLECGAGKGCTPRVHSVMKTHRLNLPPPHTLGRSCTCKATFTHSRVFRGTNIPPPFSKITLCTQHGFKKSCHLYQPA